MSNPINPIAHDLCVGIQYANPTQRRVGPNILRSIYCIDEVATFDAARIIDERTMLVWLFGQRGTTLQVHLAPGQSMAEAVDQSVAELEDPIDPPAFDDPNEEALARFAMPILKAHLSA
jgi:hypothetical protein